MKKSAMLLAGLLTCFGLVSCDDSATPETASLYGVINDCLVGKIDITYTGKTVSEAKIDEAYFLTQTALLPAEHEGIADTDTISVTVKGWSGPATNTYSKYMKVGDTVYTGTLREATSEEYGLAEYIKWTSSSTADLFNSVKSSAAADRFTSWGEYSGTADIKFKEENTITFNLTRVDADTLVVGLTVNGTKVSITGTDSDGMFSSDNGSFKAVGYTTSSNSLGQRCGFYPSTGETVLVTDLKITGVN